MEKVIIVVPVYKTKLNEMEEMSIIQLCIVLKDYPKIFVAPKSLDFEYEREFHEFGCLRVSDDFFGNQKNYSKMCISEEFYENFLDYEYMLIYQLDAFVFSDRLMEFCEKGFDYIGAPVPLHHWKRNIGTRVGNGGFSLRKISGCLRVLKNKAHVFQEANLNGILLSYEDMFWGYASTLHDLEFKAPDTDGASKFSIEYNFCHSYRGLKNCLPFGCHNWYRENFDVWWPIIQAYGYNVSSESKCLYTNRGNRALTTYLWKRFHRKKQVHCNQIIERLASDVFDTQKAYSIWGYGRLGIQCERLLKMMRIPLIGIYDEKMCGNISNNGIVITPPSRWNILNKRSVVIITPSHFKAEICRVLLQWGLKAEKDFICLSELAWHFVRNYYNLLMCENKMQGRE